MLFFLALSCLAVATASSVAFYQIGAAKRLGAGGSTAGGGGADGGGRGRALPPAAQPPAKSNTGTDEPTLETLDLGDVVVAGDEDWLVEGSLVHQEERQTWAQHALNGGAAGQRLLEVRRTAGVLEVTLFERVEDAPLFGQLLAGLTYRAQPYTLDVRGDARVRLAGEVPGRGSGQLKYARYKGPGDERLLVEEEGAARRAFFGRAVPPQSLTVYPGELNRLK